ncbi:MAG: DUF2029 domain-containing protein [Planctomycetes bacterium]|nr:DUF2029 domain-containing protein [Planctomycetota bacterium]
MGKPDFRNAGVGERPLNITDKTDRLVTATLLGGALILVGFTLWLQWFWAGSSMDIDVYWEAGTRMMGGGAELYQESQDPVNRVGLFIYPPFFATLFAPLTVLPRWLGYAVWGLTQLLLIAAGFRGTRRLCDVRGGPAGRLFYLLMGLGLIGAIWTNLQEGQVNMLLLSLLATGLYQLERGRNMSGGLLLAAATHLKVIPIVLLPLLIAQRRFKAAGMMAGGLVVLWLAPLLYSVPNYGLAEGLRSNIRITRDYADRIVSPRLEKQSAFALGGARAPNNALSAVARRYFDDGHKLSLNTDERAPLIAQLPEGLVKWSGLAVGALLGALAMLLAWRRRDSRLARAGSVGLGLLAAALANLLFWPHHLCLLLLVLGPLVAAGIRRGDLRRGMVAVGLVLVLCYLPLLDRFAPFDWMAILGAPTLGVLMVFALVFIHFLRRAVAETNDAPILPTNEETPTGNSAA